MKLVDLVARNLGRAASFPAVGREFDTESAPGGESVDSTCLVLPSSLTAWPETWRSAFEERAGIIEFDGNIPRDDAERYAEACVRREYQQQQV